MSLFDLTDKVAIVTGSSRGIVEIPTHWISPIIDISNYPLRFRGMT